MTVVAVPTAPALQGVNLYVKNFEDEVDDERLHKEFGKFGNITSAKVMRNETQHSKGFGFVCFSSPEEATKALTDMNGRVIVQKPLYVALAQRKEERHTPTAPALQGVNLYVKNLEDEVDDERLCKEFAKFGNITSAKVMRNETQHSKGFGFVCFSSPEEATKALTDMNGRVIVQKRLYVALAQRKEERQAHLAQLRMQRNSSRRVPQNQVQMFPQQKAYIPQMIGFRPWQSGPMQVNDASSQDATNQSNASQANPPPPTDNFLSLLHQSDLQQQKQLIGEQLYRLIFNMYPDYTGRITDMLLKMDNSDLLHMLEVHESLKAKVDEAMTVLREHQEPVPPAPTAAPRLD